MTLAGAVPFKFQAESDVKVFWHQRALRQDGTSPEETAEILSTTRRQDRRLAMVRLHLELIQSGAAAQSAAVLPMLKKWRDRGYGTLKL